MDRVFRTFGKQKKYHLVAWDGAKMTFAIVLKREQRYADLSNNK